MITLDSSLGHSIWSAPPGQLEMSFLWPICRRTPATHSAEEPVPDASVIPEPLSNVRRVASLPSSLNWAKWTLIRSGNLLSLSILLPILSRSIFQGSPLQTNITWGLPIDIRFIRGMTYASAHQPSSPNSFKSMSMPMVSESLLLPSIKAGIWLSLSLGLPMSTLTLSTLPLVSRVTVIESMPANVCTLITSSLGIKALSRANLTAERMPLPHI